MWHIHHNVLYVYEYILTYHLNFQDNYQSHAVIENESTLKELGIQQCGERGLTTAFSQ